MTKIQKQYREWNKSGRPVVCHHRDHKFYWLALAVMLVVAVVGWFKPAPGG